MDLFHKIMALIDKNSDKIPEGDYLELCDTIHELRRQVKPPSFLLDQNQPILFSNQAPVYRPTLPMTDGQPHDWMDDELPSDPDTAAQRAREELHQRWRELDEEVMYPGLNQFLQELHEEWSETDNIGPVEPGAYYPPPRQGMHQRVEDGTTVAEVSMMDID
jgi:hypothetical protein|tara:strand:- start:126 stop:611 length:486 start_codon:yes stop_codon:yes gene_type:complete